MALMQLTVIPLGTGAPGVGGYVAELQKALAAQNLPFRLHDMGTIIEGEAGELLALAAHIHALPFLQGVQRVVTQISIDDRRDKQVRLGDKVASVAARL